MCTGSFCFVADLITDSDKREESGKRERERRSSHEWFKAEPKKEEGLKPERGESKPTAAVL